MLLIPFDLVASRKQVWRRGRLDMEKEVLVFKRKWPMERKKDWCLGKNLDARYGRGRAFLSWSSTVASYLLLPRFGF